MIFQSFVFLINRENGLKDIKFSFGGKQSIFCQIKRKGFCKTCKCFIYLGAWTKLSIGIGNIQNVL